ncbi:hypothetical protein, partial [Haloferax sp. Atlit-4N]|uniref:hypothetical protein n=1 Tax=Haloferax sp. Atlit-4N TaxID=2077206 RepID=UPI001F301675
MEVHAGLGLRSDVAVGIHTRGWLAFLEGDLPRALECYADASDRFDDLDITSVDLVYDRCSAYLVAGMPADALDVVERALEARPLVETEQADLLLALAEAAFAAGDWARARSAADAACRLYQRQGRQRHWIRAELYAIWSRAEVTDRPARLLPRLETLVAAARESAAPELPHALLLGAQVGSRVRGPAAARLVDHWLDEAA